MPRIPAALAAVALVAISIGFNAVRYPLVSGSVPGRSSATQSGEDQTATNAERPAGEKESSVPAISASVSGGPKPAWANPTETASSGAEHPSGPKDWASSGTKADQETGAAVPPKSSVEAETAASDSQAPQSVGDGATSARSGSSTTAEKGSSPESVRSADRASPSQTEAVPASASPSNDGLGKDAGPEKASNGDPSALDTSKPVDQDAHVGAEAVPAGKYGSRWETRERDTQAGGAGKADSGFASSSQAEGQFSPTTPPAARTATVPTNETSNAWHSNAEPARRGKQLRHLPPVEDDIPSTTPDGSEQEVIPIYPTTRFQP